MKIMIMTDMEGVTGVHDHRKCCTADGCYYQNSRKLLTMEVNAAVAGFFAGGATEITVATGHGYDSVDLAHTGSFGVIDMRINGISIGEYGGYGFCARELGIPIIFAAGDRALTLEAQALTPGVFTVAGKWGLVADGGKSAGLTTAEYSSFNLAACHRSPESVRSEIEKTARAAAEQWHRDPASFHYPDLKPPFRLVRIERGTAPGDPPTALYAEDPASYIACLNKLHTPEAKRMNLADLPAEV